MNKNVVIAAVIILVMIGGFLWYRGRSETPAPAAGSNTNATSTPSGARWSFTEAGEDAQTGAPLTNVTLEIGGKRYDVGTYVGSCAEKRDDLLEGEVRAAVCWFAGGGKEIGVFNEDGRVVIKEGDVDEGDAETAGFRGNFKTVITL